MDELNEKGRFNALVTKLFGDPAVTSLEHRILNAILFLVSLTAVLSTVVNVVLHNPAVMTFVSVLCCAGGIAGYWLGHRLRQWQVLVAPMLGLFLVLLSVGWITQAGTEGSVGYYFFLLIVFAVVIPTGTGKVLSLSLTAAVMTALLMVELLAPDAILPHDTPLQRFADVAFGWFICLVVTATMVYVLYGEYQRERRAKDLLLRQVMEEKELAQRSMRAKQRLLSMVCHDIANALTVVQNAVTLLRPDGDAGPKLAPQAMGYLRFAIGNIDEIIRSVRLMEAVEQGKLSLSLVPVALGEVIDKVERMFSDRLAERRIRLDGPSEALRAVKVLAEPRILANHMLSNLVSNAIKFSHEGSSIGICVESRNSEVAVAVVDHGIGIPRNIIPHLFDPLSRTTRPGVDGEPGTGFGLMTVKNFVELFGGSIAVESTPEDDTGKRGGTVVTVYLKRADDRPLLSGG